MLDASKYLDEKLLERYHVKKEIGRGASSVVFYAEDIMTRGDDGNPLPVALKILDKDSNEYKINSKSFYIETRAVVGMPANAHTVAVRDVAYDPERDVHFIVMEYVKGTTLRRYMASRGAFSSREIISVALQILEALRLAHEAGVVHRDVKPQNILVQDTSVSGSVIDGLPGGKNMPYVKLADFGIALLPNEDPLKMKDRGVGTVHYISPEQARGDKVDPRSDLYSLGVVMYELATGRVPFDAESATAVINKHQIDAPTHARAINPNVSLLLDTAIFTAMQKDPSKRFRDAAAMEKYLKEALKELDGLAVSATPQIPEYKAPLIKNKKKFIKTTVITASAALLVGLAIFFGIMIPRWLDGGTVVTVPNFVGAVYDESATLDEGLSVVVKKEYSDEVPAGTVIEQSHGAGTVVKGSVTVTLTVSLGAEPVDFDLPVANRDSFDEAKAYIEALKVGDHKKIFYVNPTPDVLTFDESKGAIGEVIGVRYADGTEINMNGEKVIKRSVLTLVINGQGVEFSVPMSERRDTSKPADDPSFPSYEKAKAYIEKTYGDKIEVVGYIDAESGGMKYDNTLWGRSVIGAVNAVTGERIDIDGDQVHIPVNSKLRIKLILNG